MRTTTAANDKAFQQFQNNLILLERSLEKSNEVRNKMVNILDRFEARFSVLEKDMTDMNKRIDKLKLGHDSNYF